jgi:hypothetical protein
MEEKEVMKMGMEEESELCRLRSEASASRESVETWATSRKAGFRFNYHKKTGKA